jgi:anti-sigma regulatory factor (Ser/Thr protein kinase)
MSATAAHTLSLTITNDLTALWRVRELVQQGVERGGFPVEHRNRLQIAVDEAVTNIIEHGYADQPPGAATIELVLTVDRDAFRIDIQDHGQTFDPEKLADVDIRRHVEAGSNGGLGVFLMRRIMDLIEYHAETGRKNRLVLVKYR